MSKAIIKALASSPISISLAVEIPEGCTVSVHEKDGTAVAMLLVFMMLPIKVEFMSLMTNY